MPKYQHHNYAAQAKYWRKYRLIYNGGQAFVDAYLEKFSTKETSTDFVARKAMTYIPAHAKAILTEIRNSIFQRLNDITRTQTSNEYNHFVESNVDGQGSSILRFFGMQVLPELLSMGSVGVYVDRMPMDMSMITKRESLNNLPYCYIYKVEDILSTTVDDKGNITAAYLRTWVDVLEDGLTTGQQEIFKHIYFNEDGFVEIKTYDSDESEKTATIQTLDLKIMPFVVFDIGESLLKDIANHQIALLNMGSSDVRFAVKANFPFYVEQYDPRTDNIHLKDGESPEKPTGTTQGRLYPAGLNQPAFINPSAECLQVSMEKQRQIAAEARQLVNLTIQNLQPIRQSADSKQTDDQRTLQIGLAYIGLALQAGEQQIANIFEYYMGINNTPLIIYPTDYDLKSDTERIVEAEKQFALIDKLPSPTYQFTLVKQGIETLFGPRISAEVVSTIMDELEQLPIINTNTLIEDVEAGLVSDATASRLRGYPESEIEIARKSHEDRLTRIAIAQTEGAAAARGIDTQGNADAEKQDDLKKEMPR